MSGGGEFRVGSGARPGPEPARCARTWTGRWEDRVESRPICGREPGHDGPHSVDLAGVDGQCRRYRWTDGGDARVEPC